MARVAVVTGGTRGIGEAISVGLKNAGFTVAANYAGNDERAKAFSDRTGIKSYQWDVASFDDCVAGVKKVEAELGRLACDAKTLRTIVIGETIAKEPLEDRLQTSLGIGHWLTYPNAEAVATQMTGTQLVRVSTDLDESNAFAIEMPQKSAPMAQARHRGRFVMVASWTGPFH